MSQSIISDDKKTKKNYNDCPAAKEEFIEQIINDEPLRKYHIKKEDVNNVYN